MKYKLVIYCDVCDRQAQGMLINGPQGTGVGPPDGWGFKQWPNGDQTVVCSKVCAKQIDTSRRSIIVPSRAGIMQ
jgi:hypothetical protein